MAFLSEGVLKILVFVLGGTKNANCCPRGSQEKVSEGGKQNESKKKNQKNCPREVKWVKKLSEGDKIDKKLSEGGKIGGWLKKIPILSEGRGGHGEFPPPPPVFFNGISLNVFPFFAIQIHILSEVQIFSQNRRIFSDFSTCFFQYTVICVTSW